MYGWWMRKLRRTHCNIDTTHLAKSFRLSVVEIQPEGLCVEAWPISEFVFNQVASRLRITPDCQIWNTPTCLTD